MAHPAFTHYLLKLATDPDELERFNAAAKDERDAMLERAGLTPSQRDALCSCDSGQIMDEVRREVHGGQVPTASPHYTIQLMLNLQPCRKE